MDKQLMDIEVFKNFFCLGLKNYRTKEITFYEISEERNDIELIYNWLINYNGFMITFNAVHYDNMILKYLIHNYNRLKNLNYIDICLDLKYFSDKVIKDEFDDEIKFIKYYKVKWIDIDLFLYWSKMLRMSKKISLKSLGIQLGYPVVQELPFKPDTILLQKDLEILRYYNYTHDLGILELLTTEMEDEIKLRANIVTDYGLDCWSWDAPKIASEALLKDYCKTTGKNIYEVRKTRYIKNTLYLKEVLDGFDPKFKLPIFQNLFNEILQSKNSFSKELVVNYNNTSIKLTYGIGGLHSVNNNEIYETNEDYQIVTSDVQSLYPNLIINYNCIRFPEVLKQYDGIRDERVIAKKAKAKEKDKFFKLILNSTSGLLDNEHSWLYYPEGAMKLRLIGQLILTKCIEVCLINNWQVVSANTDGIEVIVPKSHMKQYKDLIDIAAREFNLIMEHEYYKKIVYSNVNSYIAITEEDKFKRKGLFKVSIDEKGNREIPLGDSVNENIIAKALTLYFTQNIQPSEVIKNPDKYNLELFDYCKSNKVSKNFTVYHNGQIVQNLNRYYFSKNAPYLFKRKDDQGTYQHMNVNEGVILYNEHIIKPWNEYNINYNYYISSTNKIISELENHNQLTLF